MNTNPSAWPTVDDEREWHGAMEWTPTNALPGRTIEPDDSRAVHQEAKRAQERADEVWVSIAIPPPRRPTPTPAETRVTRRVKEDDAPWTLETIKSVLAVAKMANSMPPELERRIDRELSRLERLDRALGRQ